MKINRCDRCGEEIRPQSGWLHHLAKAIDGITGKPDYKIYNANGGEPVDLCPACQQSFNAWISGQHQEPERSHAVEEIHITDTELCRNIETKNIPKFGD